MARRKYRTIKLDEAMAIRLAASHDGRALVEGLEHHRSRAWRCADGRWTVRSIWRDPDRAGLSTTLIYHGVRL